MSFYWIWIPAAILLYIVCGYWTIWANDKSDPNSIRWVWALYLINILGLWPWIARFSKNLVLDGLLYDLIIFFVFYLTVLCLGAAKGFTTVQWVGTGVVIVGFVMIKVGAYW